MHTKITCCGWNDWVTYCAPFMDPLALASGCGVRTRARDAQLRAQVAEQLPTVNPFQSLPKMSVESDMYAEIVDALNGADICPGYKFVATPYKADESEPLGQAVDCGLYPSDHAPDPDPEDSKTEGFGRVAWSWIEIAIECKFQATDGDPFDESKDHGEPDADKRREVLGQILSYAELVFHYQHRTHQFMILFIGGNFRILRIDRSGLFVTRKMDCKTDGLKLVHFLWYLSRLPPDVRGHDTTAERLAPDSDKANRMRSRVEHVADDDYVAEAFKKLLNPQWAWWRLQVQDDIEPKNSRYFLVGKPHFQAPGVAGRATRGYIALEDVDSDDADGEDAKFVYLKDSWRVVHTDIQKEGDTLEFLREKEINYVPTLVCHGDIAGQETLSQKIWSHFHPKEEKCNLKTHQHYRLVVEEVGKPLEEFSHGWQLVYALCCCLIAHSQAYEAGLIHRDISAGNMLLYHNGEEWCGLLNDWELSKRLDQQEKEGRQPDRTGTWQFLSAAALNDHSKKIVVQDELESYFHVLLHLALRFLPHNCDNAKVPQLLHDFFDDYKHDPESGNRCGDKKYNSMRFGSIALANIHGKDKESQGDLVFLWEQPAKDTPSKATSTETPPPTDPPQSAQCPSSQPSPAAKQVIYHPINAIVETLLKWFSAHYTLENMKTRATPAAAPETSKRPKKLSKTPAFRKAMQTATARAGAGSSGSIDAASPSNMTPSQGPAPEMANKPEKELRELAGQLKTHAAMLKLFDRALDNEDEWPLKDKCPDKRPKKWKHPKGRRVPKGTTITASGAVKRGSMYVEDAQSTPSTPSKKPRK